MPKRRSITQKRRFRVICDKNIVYRTFHLVTQGDLLPFYALALYYSFIYAPQTLTSPRTWKICILKILPLVWLLEVLRRSPDTICNNYVSFCRFIMLGLVFSIFGDIIMAWDDQLVFFAIAIFSLAHFSYIAAFYQHFTVSFYSRYIYVFNFIVTVILCLLINELFTILAIIFYALVISTAGFLALARLEMKRTAPAYLGCAGMTLFMLSDVFIAINEMVPQVHRPISQTLLMMVYYLGQMGITLSTFRC